MGCGAGKTTREAVLDVRTPAAKPPKPSKPRMVAEPSNKLDSEVLEGLAKLLRRFSTIEMTKQKSKPTKPLDNYTIPYLAKDTSDRKQESNGSFPRNLAKTAGKATNGEAISASVVPEPKSTFSEIQVKPVPMDIELHPGNPDIPESSVDQRYSPEPPRPLDPSDDESYPVIEDEHLKRQRLEREVKAREEAERRAMEQRAELELQAAQQIGKMTSMQSQAQDILSKYQ